MNDLQKEFEKTGEISWINSDIYPDGKIYTKAYTEWLENKVKNSSLPSVSVTEGKFCHVCGSTEYYITDDGHKACKKHKCYLTSGKN